MQGFLSRPLLANVPEAKEPTWELVRCECGNLCWRLPIEPDPLPRDVIAGCSQCAIRRAIAALKTNASASVAVSHPLPKSACLSCGHVMDWATGVTGSTRPREGDVTLCIKCGEIHFYGKSLELRRPSEAELRQLQDAPGTLQVLQQAQASIRSKV